MMKDKRFFYDDIASEFDQVMNVYDLHKRLELVFDEFLKEEDLRNKRLLDAGCGTGWFSVWANQRGAQVFSLDIGEKLLQLVALKCESERAAGDLLALPYASNEFDVIVCSEAIEHTLAPKLAVQELARVLKVGGLLVLTVPNQLWHFSVRVANRFGLRPYEGYENWVKWSEVEKWSAEFNFEIVNMRGLHLLPFISPKIYPLLSFADGWRRLDRLMLNIGFLGRKLQ